MITFVLVGLSYNLIKFKKLNVRKGVILHINNIPINQFHTLSTCVSTVKSSMFITSVMEYDSINLV